MRLTQRKAVLSPLDLPGQVADLTLQHNFSPFVDFDIPGLYPEVLLLTTDIAQRLDQHWNNKTRISMRIMPRESSYKGNETKRNTGYET